MERGRMISVESPILLVEDNPDDVLITQRAWKKGCIRNPLHVVNNGEEALLYLQKKGKYIEASTPCLILLDLKMPKIDGFEVLENIKKDEVLKSVPVIVLTSSDRSKDVKDAYQLGCNSYIVKPIDFDKFINAILEIKEYWLTICKIPSTA